ncbi:diheme cytochrome c [Terasakiella sp. SH-1]|uniref:diheme cytochrome c n=1 Tax=Terasakiella sp. SH-1 TaxID=2560057 RepID=UPI0010735287|nr:diheme cytochrome c [Terasakiella sp. SH-1]
MFARKIAPLTLGLMALSSTNVFADERFAPIKDETVRQECGDCHMAFQPQFLPKRSWRKIMTTLDNHFGEDASLDTETAERITRYLVEHAADAGWWNGKFLRGVKENDVPLRISELPYWVREHNEEVPARAWSAPKVKSKANCKACHPNADAGNYDDD